MTLWPDSCITQYTFRLISQFSLTLSHGHLFVVSHISVKRCPSDKVKENYKTNLKVRMLCYAAIIQL